MKREQLNRWSPWHKYISTDIMNIGIPEETSLFTELKTLTENDSERSVRGLRRQQNGAAHFNGRQRKPARSRGAASIDATRKHERTGEEEAVDADVTDLMAQVHLKTLYTTRGAGETWRHRRIARCSYQERAKS